MASVLGRCRFKNIAGDMQLLNLQHTRNMTHAVQGHTRRHHNCISK